MRVIEVAKVIRVMKLNGVVLMNDTTNSLLKIEVRFDVSRPVIPDRVIRVIRDMRVIGVIRVIGVKIVRITRVIRGVRAICVLDVH